MSTIEVRPLEGLPFGARIRGLDRQTLLDASERRRIAALFDQYGVLVFEEPFDLPRVGLLYAGAEGFLSLPGVGGLFVPHKVGGVSSGESPDSDSTDSAVRAA